MQILRQISDKYQINFSGKLNLLDLNTKKYLGAIYFKKGIIVQVDYLGTNGELAILCVVFDELFPLFKIEYVAELEIVEMSENCCQFDLKKFKSFLEQSRDILERMGRLRPPHELQIIAKINPRGQSPEGPESLRILEICRRKISIKNLYRELDIPQYLFIKTVVDLKSKKLIQVVS